jgi:hypothetical protein
MSSQIFHIEIEEETDVTKRFFYTNISTGLPIDLTGYKAELQVRERYEGTSNLEPVLTYSSETGGGIVLGGTNGTVDIFISYSDTLNKTWNNAVYSLILIAPSGARSLLVKGFFTILGGASKIATSIYPTS